MVASIVSLLDEVRKRDTYIGQFEEGKALDVAGGAAAFRDEHVAGLLL